MDELIITFCIEYRDVIDKYKSFFSNVSAGFLEWSNEDLEAKLEDTNKEEYLQKTAIDINAVVAVIQEFGYDYVYDLLVNYRPTQEDVTPYIEQTKAFLNFIHIMKGHKVGLLFIVSLLSIEAYTKEWWEIVDEFASYAMEDNPLLTWAQARAANSTVALPDTFQLRITAHIPPLELIYVLISFCRKYVYPIVEIVIEQLSRYDKPCVVTGASGDLEYMASNLMKVAVTEGFTRSGCSGDVEMRVLSDYIV